MLATILTILGMIIIGAIIGGITNLLAIKMLFRPYNAKYLGKWKIPFTPGLIPKRRDELAKQLGMLVVNHLVTPDTLRNKLKTEKIEHEMKLFLDAQLMKMIKRDFTVIEIAHTFGADIHQWNVEKHVDRWINKSFRNYLKKNSHIPLKEILPSSIQQSIELTIPEVTNWILLKGEKFFSSKEGAEMLEKWVSTFFQNKGMFWNMIQMFLGQSNIAEKIQPEMIRVLKHQNTKDWLENLLSNEWSNLLQMKVETLVEKIGNDRMESGVTEVVRMFVKQENILQFNISQWIERNQFIINKLIAKGIAFGREFLINRIEGIMDKLQIAEMVKQQVESFPVERLEEIVLSITKKELKMITFLGAFIGGIIGLIQGVIVSLLP